MSCGCLATAGSQMLLCRICELQVHAEDIGRHTEFCLVVQEHKRDLNQIEAALRKILRALEETSKEGNTTEKQRGVEETIAHAANIKSPGSYSLELMQNAIAVMSRSSIEARKEENDDIAILYEGALAQLRKGEEALRGLTTMTFRLDSVRIGRERIEAAAARPAAVKASHARFMSAAMELVTFTQDGQGLSDAPRTERNARPLPSEPGYIRRSQSVGGTFSLSDEAQAIVEKFSVAHNIERGPVGIADFDILKPISKGAFGRVYLCSKKVTGDIFAVKVLSKVDMDGKNQKKRAELEQAIMRSIQHDFVVPLFYSFQSEKNLFFVMEYCPGGDLHSLLAGIGALGEDAVQQYAGEILLALRYLHSKGVLHRDLKPDNILIAADGHIKLTDFGLSEAGIRSRRKTMMRPRYSEMDDDRTLSKKRLTSFRVTSATMTRLRAVQNKFRVRSSNALGPAQGERADSGEGSSMFFRRMTRSLSVCSSDSNEEDFDFDHPLTVQIMNVLKREGSEVRSTSLSNSSDSSEAGAGTPDYLAPELISGEKHGTGVDIWALGTIMYEMLVGIPPFNAPTVSQIFENIQNRNCTWEFDDGEPLFSEAAKRLLEAMLVVDTKDRCNVKFIQGHDFFAGVDWENHRESDPPFIPVLESIDDTSYFDRRNLQDLAEIIDDEMITPKKPRDDAEAAPSAGGAHEPDSIMEGGSEAASSDQVLLQAQKLSSATVERPSPRTFGRASKSSNALTEMLKKERGGDETHIAVERDEMGPQKHQNANSQAASDSIGAVDSFRYQNNEQLSKMNLFLASRSMSSRSILADEQVVVEEEEEEETCKK
eukprot:g3962.t1